MLQTLSTISVKSRIFEYLSCMQISEHFYNENFFLRKKVFTGKKKKP